MRDKAFAGHLDAMGDAEFWHLIEQAMMDGGGECEAQVRLLIERLAQYAPDHILAFDRVFESLITISYDQALWAGAYIINGGCSDDGFDYFRGWLIGQGKEAFFGALHDPEKLADIVPIDAVRHGWVECEAMLGVASHAYEQRTGQPMPFCPRDDARVLTGGAWDETTVATLYPNLALWVRSVQRIGEVDEQSIT